MAGGGLKFFRSQLLSCPAPAPRTGVAPQMVPSFSPLLAPARACQREGGIPCVADLARACLTSRRDRRKLTPRRRENKLSHITGLRLSIVVLCGCKYSEISPWRILLATEPPVLTGVRAEAGQLSNRFGSSSCSTLNATGLHDHSYVDQTRESRGAGGRIKQDWRFMRTEVLWSSS